MKIDKRHLLNYSILLPYLILSVLGLIMVYSTTSATLIQYYLSPFRSVLNQGAFWLLSLTAISFIYKLKLNFLNNSKVLTLVMMIEVFLLIVARFFTKEVNGAHGWIVLGPISFQPAEYLKIIIVWYLASTFSRRQKEIATYDYQALTRNRWWPNQFSDLKDWRVYSMVLILLVAAQPDLGNAAIIVLTIIMMISVSGIGYKWFSALLTLITITSAIFLGSISVIGVERVARIPVFGYVAKRFERTANSAQLKEKYADKSKEELHDLNETAIVAGRLMTKRGKGKVGFAHLQDREGQIQLYVRKDAVGEENYDIFKKADLGDFIGVEGEVMRTDMGELSIKATKLTVLLQSFKSTIK